MEMRASDRFFEGEPRRLALADYQGNAPRWCPGCGDHAALTAVQRLLRDEQIRPEDAVIVSGIGCSSRFPHYMSTYGFHGLHGRALPIAEGVRARRPELHVFVVMGDGDCCAIGTAHWIHAIRYNMKMVVLLLDNNIYGLTKMQSSPTTPKGERSNTHPDGVALSPLDPLSVTLGITNVSFVAQSADWLPAHLLSVLRAAHAHPGLAFVRVLLRCPHYMDELWAPLREDPSRTVLLHHPEGISLGAAGEHAASTCREHDPRDLAAARALAGGAQVPLGILYRDPGAERYDVLASRGVGMAPGDKLAALERELSQFAI